MAVEFGRRGTGGGHAPVMTASGGHPVGGLAALSGQSVQEWLRMTAQIGAAALIGFGLMLWVAAHWDEISRSARFAIVGGALAASVLLSLVNAARTPGLLLSFLATGGQLALIGQTYQTGADPWQLFAVWAAIGVPWALAARSDAVWLVWAVVAMLAITLWLATFGGVGGWTRDRQATLAAWLMAVALATMLSPFAQLQRWLGQTRWAFRLTALLAIVLVTQSGLADLFTARAFPILYWLALALLGGAAGLLLASTSLDIALISVLGLSLDTLLITGFAKLILQSGAFDFGSFLLIGLAGAGLVAGTGALILKLMRERAGGGLDIDILKGSEWPVILMTGIGALLTTIPLSMALSFLFGVFLATGLGPYVIGIGLLAGSVKLIRGHAQVSFVHQLAAIGLTLGYCLVAYGLFRDMDGSIAPASVMLAAVAVGLALVVGNSWTAALLGAAAGVFAALFFNQILALGPTGKDLAKIVASPGWMLLLAIGAAWIVWRGGLLAQFVPADAFGAPFESEPRLIGGAMVAGLLGAMATAGPTFLLSGAMGIDGFGSHRHLATAVELSWRALSPLSALLALAGCALLLLPRPQYQTALGIGAAVVVVVLSAIVPSLGGPILLLCAAAATGHRVLAIGGLIAALWVIGAFYYWLGWPLADKAALMLAAGLALGGLCVATGLRRPPFRSVGGSVTPAVVARVLILAGALAAGALAAQSIKTNEAIISSGRQIFLALAPVDPRSLIQGDYMRLNFAVPADVRRSTGSDDGHGRRWAVALVDDRQVAAIERMTDQPPGAIGDGRIALPMRRSQGRWIVGTDAWFFKEGTAAKWQEARFGVFRVGGNGTALLVGMADKDLKQIK
ncbi:MAG: GDYXXLXY domain-containing protein [Hyphomicrobiaceae bacterium]